MADDALAEARARMAEAARVFVFCDDAPHPARRVPVTNFVAVPGGGWHEVPASRATTGRAGTGYHLVSDEPAADGWALDDAVRNADVRDRHEMTCRKCRRPLVARAENLSPLLDKWSALGVGEVSLSQLAASLGRRSGD